MRTKSAMSDRRIDYTSANAKKEQMKQTTADSPGCYLDELRRLCMFRPMFYITFYSVIQVTVVFMVPVAPDWCVRQSCLTG